MNDQFRCAPMMFLAFFSALFVLRTSFEHLDAKPAALLCWRPTDRSSSIFRTWLSRYGSESVCCCARYYCGSRMFFFFFCKQTRSTNQRVCLRLLRKAYSTPAHTRLATHPSINAGTMPKQLGRALEGGEGDDYDSGDDDEAFARCVVFFLLDAQGAAALNAAHESDRVHVWWCW